MSGSPLPIFGMDLALCRFGSGTWAVLGLDEGPTQSAAVSVASFLAAEHMRQPGSSKEVCALTP